jgi:hypothetical protein
MFVTNQLKIFRVLLSPLETLKVEIHKTKILSVLYGCETWSLNLKEEHTLRLFENKVMKIIFVPKRKEVAGGRRRLHNVELHNLYASLNIIMVIK